MNIVLGFAAKELIFLPSSWYGAVFHIYRITEQFGYERTLKITSFQLTCPGQGHLPLQHVAQSPIQPGLELVQGWGIHNFCGQLVPPHPLSEELLSNV